MTFNSIEKETRKILSAAGHINSKEAERLVRLILADNYVSRTEKRFVGKILRRNVCDDEAFRKLTDLLAGA